MNLLNKNCPRKIRDKEQSGVNEFLECHIVHIVKPFFRLHHLKFYNDINAQKQINKLAKKYKNKSVVIYGAGLMSYVLFENFDLSKLNITAICDAKYKNESSETFFTYKTISPQELQETECDAILICLKEHEKIRQYIKYNLLVNTKNKNIEVQRLLNIPLSFIIKQISG